MAKEIPGQINAGIIGAGLMGHTHSMMIRQIADRTSGSVRVSTVADANFKSAEALAAKWPGAKAVANADEILADPAIDAVWICTPTAQHREVCIGAARAGKHVFCEKPLAMSAADAAEMGKELKAAGVVSQVGLVLRYSPIYTVIQTMAEEAQAGAILAVTMRDDQDFPIRGVHDSRWRNDPAQTAGGTLIEHGVHDFDLFTWMFGPVERIYCKMRNVAGAAGVEDLGMVTFEFKRGFAGQMTSIWHKMIGRPSNRRLEVFCENAFIASDYDVFGSIIVQRGDAEREETIQPYEVLNRFNGITTAKWPHLRDRSDLFAIPYALEDATFLSAIRGECDPYPDFDSGVAAQCLVEAAYDSARTGLPVDLRGR
ncbi:MAG TPA: Gfo/Idh/MocA family oxidoreductase [Candidatus Binataceae bacterium]|nr:Gfo/Idh/MocA family oxidoreductase [Candidatus Binataceae bacterium]